MFSKSETMMSKVGILTLYYKTYNYGAQLQAYALQKAVERCGFACEQIRFVWNDVQTEINYANSSIDQEQFVEFSAGIPHSKRVYTPENIAECVDEYDIFVCGSDQIWGVPRSMPIYVLPMMALSFVPGYKQKIAYAASMGGCKLPSGRASALEPAVKRLDAISVRETSAISYIQGMTARKVQAALDPVFLLDTSEWSRLAISRMGDTPYILVYGIGRNPGIFRMAEDLAEQMGCRMIKLGYVDSESYGPRDFLGLVKDASCVLTDSFHGVVLSILFQKSFFAFGVKSDTSDFSSNHRILDLLELFGLQERYLDADLENTHLYRMRDMDYKKVMERLQVYRKKSFSFLSGSLKKSTKKAKAYEIVSRKYCTGCGTCVRACPEHCIFFSKDQFGFSYPNISMDACTECGVCREMCPALNKERYCEADCEDMVSPVLWQKYLDYQKQKGIVRDIAVRYDGQGNCDAMDIDFGSHKELILREEDCFLSIMPDFCRESCYHCLMKGDSCRQMKKSAAHDYLRNLARKSSIEKLYYENRWIQLFQEKEQMQRNFWIELQRNELLRKLEGWSISGLSVDEFPGLAERVIIYGAGKLGRLLSGCFTQKLDCLIDRSGKLDFCEGYTVFRPDSAVLEKRIEDGRDYSVIVTPVWEYETIREMLLDRFPLLNVISLKTVMERMYKERIQC